MSTRERYFVYYTMVQHGLWSGYLYLIALLFMTVPTVAGSYEDRKCPVNPIHSESSSIEGRHSNDESLMVIPVVVHVVYQNEDQNISYAQIESQIRALNLDFRKNNQNVSTTVEAFADLITDAKIIFELTQIDTQGKSVNGVTRTSSEHGAFANNDLHQTTLGGTDAWNPNKYLNIWVANLADGIIGYASSPTGDEGFNGIAIHYENFGTEGTAKSPYDLGRTLTHEAGHWLGLNHLWGDGGCSSDDGISDTPNQEKSSSGCQQSKTTCGSLDMVQNFMDFSDDSCMTFFTNGQVEVMRNTLVAHRSTVYFTRSVLGDLQQSLSHQQIECAYHNGILIIKLKSVSSHGLLTVYNTSGKMLLSQTVVMDKQQKIRVEPVSDFNGLHVVRYKTGKRSFFTKFMGNR